MRYLLSLPINKTILKLNIAFSIAFAFLYSALSFTDSIKALFPLFILIFVISLLSVGFLLSVFYFELTRKNEYYFYYNLGFGKIKLYILAYLFNIIFILPFILILYYVSTT